MLNIFTKKFLNGLIEVFSYSPSLPLRRILSVFIFLFLLLCCFGGYFTYSFTPCGILEFTLTFALISWLTTLLSFISSEKFSVYIRKGGDSFMKTLVLMPIELVREFSRPFSLTIRLTVNISVGHLIRMSLYQFLELRGGDKYIWLTVLAIIIECFVFFIQSYVFSRLVYLYLNE